MMQLPVTKKIASEYLMEKDCIERDIHMQGYLSSWFFKERKKRNEDRLKAAFFVDTYEYNSLDSCMQTDVPWILKLIELEG